MYYFEYFVINSPIHLFWHFYKVDLLGQQNVVQHQTSSNNNKKKNLLFISKRNIRRMLSTLYTHKMTDTRLDCNTQTIKDKQHWIRPFKNDYDNCSRKMFLRLHKTTQFDQCERGLAVSLIRQFKGFSLV